MNTREVYTQLALTPRNFYKNLVNIVRFNKHGQRIRIVVPREISHLSDNKGLDWEEIEGIEQYMRGGLEADQFLTLRFEEDDDINVIIDVYHL